jgi:hypothetical protein
MHQGIHANRRTSQEMAFVKTDDVIRDNGAITYTLQFVAMAS